ncbi:ATP-binding protein [Actinomadura sp. KC216]|uniref:GTP-binding protein n=1 Tax=Actinomadura sp. KC216 TaxID=2530370 RepID=UPI00104E83AA|nr:ATP/GTP-binding protein [Actinomadura sp. KC216]TDB88843.1 ATP-binding protein [Actinomadura sp. KC216]
MTAPTTQPGPGAAAHLALKIVVAGGFGAGKTTLIGSISEIEPLTTEEILTEAGEPIDSLDGVHGKVTTTVSLDHGRRTLTVPEPMMLQLFGTPGQDRFRFLWDDLSQGAVGAVVLADTRRLADSFPSIDYFEERGTPFVVAFNHFDGADRYTTGHVRNALDLPERVPVVDCDARDFGSTLTVLKTLVRHALACLTSPSPNQPADRRAAHS